MKKLGKFALQCAIPALVFSAGTMASAQALPDTDPAIWVVKDPDTTIYLFGTFHALDGKTDWFNDEVKTAFDRSSEVVLEVVDADDPAKMQPIIAKYAFDKSGRTLTSKLSPKAREKFAKHLAAMGAPANAFDGMKPFFASLVLVVGEAAKLGLTGENGSEKIITKAAKAGGKPMSALETAEFQIAMFDALPEAKQVELLEQTLDALDELPELFTQMQKRWNAGDAEGFAKMMQEMNAESPESYRIIFTDRNARWADWIDQRLDKPGTVFMAVGAGHLAGKDSVQQMLGKRGIKAARLP